MKLRDYVIRHHVGLIAIVIALIGVPAAWAIGKNSIGAKQIKANAVGASEMKDNAIGSAEVQNDSLTGGDINESTLQQAPNLTGFTNAVVRSKTATAPNGAFTDTAMCAPGEVAVGGSVIPDLPNRPSPTTGTPTGWLIGSTSPGQYTIYVICAS